MMKTMVSNTVRACNVVFINQPHRNAPLSSNSCGKSVSAAAPQGGFTCVPITNSDDGNLSGGGRGGEMTLTAGAGRAVDAIQAAPDFKRVAVGKFPGRADG